MKFSKLLSGSSSSKLKFMKQTIEQEDADDDRQNLFAEFPGELSDKELTHYGFPVDPLISHSTKRKVHERLFCVREKEHTELSDELSLDDALPPPSPEASLGSLPNSFYRPEIQQQGLDGKTSTGSLEKIEANEPVQNKNSANTTISTCRNGEALTYPKEWHHLKEMDYVLSNKNKENRFFSFDENSSKTSFSSRALPKSKKLSSFSIPDCAHVYADLEGGLCFLDSPASELKMDYSSSCRSNSMGSFNRAMDEIVASGPTAIRSRRTEWFSSSIDEKVLIFHNQDPDLMEHPLSPSSEKEPSCPDDEWNFHRRAASGNAGLVMVPEQEAVSPMRRDIANRVFTKIQDAVEPDSYTYGVQRQIQHSTKKGLGKETTTAVPPKVITVAEEENVPVSPLLSSPSVQRAYTTKSLLDPQEEEEELDTPESPLLHKLPHTDRRLLEQAQFQQRSTNHRCKSGMVMEVKPMRPNGNLKPFVQPMGEQNEASPAIQKATSSFEDKKSPSQTSTNSSIIASLTTPVSLPDFANEDNYTLRNKIQMESLSTRSRGIDHYTPTGRPPLRETVSRLNCLTKSNHAGVFVHPITPTENDDSYDPIFMEAEI